jgi:hypothetical protein|tara:strand:+ start:416 stop:535 length:120 start_codon:yes stop_codon:yes gene_type:complete
MVVKENDSGMQWEKNTLYAILLTEQYTSVASAPRIRARL